MKSPEQSPQDINSKPEDWGQLQVKLDEARQKHKTIQSRSQINGDSSYFDKVRNMLATCDNWLLLPYTPENADKVKQQLLGLEEYFDLIESDPKLFEQEIGETGELQQEAKTLAGNSSRLYVKALKEILNRNK